MVNADLLRQAHFQYLKYAGKNGRQYLPFAPGDDRVGETRIRASHLFGCPLATAYKRSGIAATHSNLSVENDYATQQRFRDGLDSEAIWQEALEWAGYKCRHQVSFETPEVVGRCDTIVDDEWLIEYKKTEYRIPTMKHRGQCALYMRELGLHHGFLILQHRDYNDIWSFTHERDVNLFVAGGGAAEVLFDGELDREIARQELSVAMATSPVLRPGECSKEGEKKLYPTALKNGGVKPGELTVRCEYFGICWGKEGDHYNTVIDSGKVVIV